MGIGKATQPARYAESSGTDADRQRVVSGNAGAQRTWNFLALRRGNIAGVIVIRAGYVRHDDRR